MNQLNPTLADGLWTWRQRLGDAAMILSTLVPDQTLRAAREVARELAQDDRVVVLTDVGANEPLFWHVPAGKELDTAKPDLVLLLVHQRFTPSARLLLATADNVILITECSQQGHDECLKAMKAITERSSPSHIELVVVADGRSAAQATGGYLVMMADTHFGDRTSWRHLSARKIRGPAQNEEEVSMPTTKQRPVPVSEAETRAREWEDSFHRAEQLLEEAQVALRRQINRSVQPVRTAQAAEPAERRATM